MRLLLNSGKTIDFHGPADKLQNSAFPCTIEEDKD